MFRGTRTNRGQVLIIFVFAIIGLIGITGLAIDGGSVYADRRQAQNAADASALAAALARDNWEKSTQSICNNFNTETPLEPACSSTFINTALNTAAENNYASDLVNHTVNVYNPPKDGTYSDCSQISFSCYDYVEVIINTNVNTFFARVLGIGQLHNRVEAVALAKYRSTQSLYGGDALVILAPHTVTGQGNSGEFSTQGTSTVTLQGGDIFVNSDGSTAFVEASGCITFVMNGQHIKGPGGQKTGTCPTAPKMQPAAQVQFPPDEPFETEPTQCSLPVDQDKGTNQGNGFWLYHPGHYSQLPLKNVNTQLASGVYCIDGIVQTTNPKISLVGNGVFLYFRASAGHTGGFSFQGGPVTLTAMTTGPYAGFLLYVAPNYQDGRPSCKITASGGDTFTGIIWAPYCDTTINGNSTSLGLTAKMVVYTLQISGGGTLTFVYDDKSFPTIQEKIKTGLFH